MEIDQTPIIRDRFHRRSAIYQLERPSCRVGIVPTEEWTPLPIPHTSCNPISMYSLARAEPMRHTCCRVLGNTL